MSFERDTINILTRIERNIERILRTQRHITRKAEQIMATQTEAAAELDNLKNQLSKANEEIQAKIAELVAAAGSADVTPELQAAIDGLKPAAQTLDDIVPDVT